VTGLDWLAPIDVGEDAVKRARGRLGWDDEKGVRGEIRSAILQGRVTAQRPNWTRGCGYDGAIGHVRYVWDADATRCWVLGVARSGRLFVKTVLVDPDAYHASTAELHLRPAFRQA